jgi:serine/threonine protein kinase
MEPLVGKTILNRYQVEAFIGRGGMAEVYKIWDKNRAFHLAMKVLNADLAEDRIFLRRFEREAQTLEKLQHPTIVRYYGLEQDGTMAFVLMDYVEGESLRTEIFRKAGAPFSLTRIIEVIKSVCSALHYAHTLGMVHCDIKPSNILVKHNGEILVADFGISRMTDSSTMTMIGAGTPDYMAPEQILGHMPAPQTDIYALGIVLYEILSGGERPFTGELAEVTGSTRERVLWEQLNLQPPSLSQWNDQISTEIEAVVKRCLEKEPEHRYDNSSALLNDLEGAIERQRQNSELVPDEGEETIITPVDTIVTPDPTTPAPEPTKSIPSEPFPELSSAYVEKQPHILEKSQPKLPRWVWGIVSIAILGLAIWGGRNLFSVAYETTQVSVQSTKTVIVTQSNAQTNTNMTETPEPLQTISLTPAEITSTNQTSFSDDFSNPETFLTNWEQYGGIWSLDDGILSGSIMGEDGLLGKILVGEKTWANYTIEVDMNRLGENRDSLIYFGYKDENSNYWIDLRTSGFDDVRLYKSGNEETVAIVPYENVFRKWYKI